MVNNAGVVVVAPLIEPRRRTSTSSSTSTCTVHTGSRRRSRRCLLESKGRVVNISSLNGIVASPMIGPYSMSKHAIEAYGDALAARARALRRAREPHRAGQLRHRDRHATSWREWTRRVVKGSRFEAQMRSTINSMRAFENNPPPDEVADAVLDALTSANPKLRYLVVPAGEPGRDPDSHAHRARSSS